MAVLVEATSVIVRREKLEAAYPGGWAGFVADCPNKTLCADRHLARIGFMSPVDVEGLVRHVQGGWQFASLSKPCLVLQPTLSGSPRGGR